MVLVVVQYEWTLNVFKFFILNFILAGLAMLC